MSNPQNDVNSSGKFLFLTPFCGGRAFDNNNGKRQSRVFLIHVNHEFYNDRMTRAAVIKILFFLSARFIYSRCCAGVSKRGEASSIFNE
jgi:hypothetical protein